MTIIIKAFALFISIVNVTFAIFNVTTLTHPYDMMNFQKGAGLCSIY